MILYKIHSPHTHIDCQIIICMSVYLSVRVFERIYNIGISSVSSLIWRNHFMEVSRVECIVMKGVNDEI